MIDQINELPQDGLNCSPQTSRYTENKWISRKSQNKLYFLHLIDVWVAFFWRSILPNEILAFES